MRPLPEMTYSFRKFFPSPEHRLKPQQGLSEFFDIRKQERTMKISLIIMVSFFAVISAYATTVNLPPEKLQFAKNLKSLDHIDHGHLRVVPENIYYTHSATKDELQQALDMLEEVVNSEEFKQKVIGYVRNSNGKREYQKNYLWRNSKIKLSNEDIYKLLMEGDEKMLPGTVGEMNINVKRYWSPWWNAGAKRVIGYTNPSSSKYIYVNGRWYNRFKVSNMVSNLVHEWCHLLGFLHGREYMREEVPYIVGQIAGEVAQNILNKRKYIYN